MLQWSISWIQKRERERKNTILFWLFQVREEKREHKRRMKKLESIYKDNVRWKRCKIMLINVMEIYKDNVRWKRRKMSKTMPILMWWQFQEDALNPGEAFGEVGEKSRGSEEGEAEEDCKVAWKGHVNQKPFEPKKKVWNVSGRVKAVVRDADELKSLKMTSKMAFNCGASRFYFVKDSENFWCKQVQNRFENFPDKKLKTKMWNFRCRRCRSTTCGGQTSRWWKLGSILFYCVESVFSRWWVLGFDRVFFRDTEKCIVSVH